MKVTFERGIFLPESDLWLDPQDERDTAFVSHAHSDHTGNHREVILSEITAKLMASSIAGQKVGTFTPLPFSGPISRRLGHIATRRAYPRLGSDPPSNEGRDFTLHRRL